MKKRTMIFFALVILLAVPFSGNVFAHDEEAPVPTYSGTAENYQIEILDGNLIIVDTQGDDDVTTNKTATIPYPAHWPQNVEPLGENARDNALVVVFDTGLARVNVIDDEFGGFGILPTAYEEQNVVYYHKTAENTADIGIYTYQPAGSENTFIHSLTPYLLDFSGGNATLTIQGDSYHDLTIADAELFFDYMAVATQETTDVMGQVGVTPVVSPNSSWQFETDFNHTIIARRPTGGNPVVHNLPQDESRPEYLGSAVCLTTGTNDDEQHIQLATVTREAGVVLFAVNPALLLPLNYESANADKIAIDCLQDGIHSVRVAYADVGLNNDNVLTVAISYVAYEHTSTDNLDDPGLALSEQGLNSAIFNIEPDALDLLNTLIATEVSQEWLDENNGE